MLRNIVGDHSLIDVEGQPVSTTMMARLIYRGDVETLIKFVGALLAQKVHTHDTLAWFTYMHMCLRREPVVTIAAEIRIAECGCSKSLVQQAYDIFLAQFTKSECTLYFVCFCLLEPKT